MLVFFLLKCACLLRFYFTDTKEENFKLLAKQKIKIIKPHS
jgi:hypothetical protein